VGRQPSPHRSRWRWLRVAPGGHGFAAHVARLATLAQDQDRCHRRRPRPSLGQTCRRRPRTGSPVGNRPGHQDVVRGRNRCHPQPRSCDCSLAMSSSRQGHRRRTNGLFVRRILRSPPGGIDRAWSDPSAASLWLSGPDSGPIVGVQHRRSRYARESSVLPPAPEVRLALCTSCRTQAPHTRPATACCQSMGPTLPSTALLRKLVTVCQ
jgi:hypothetical protein